MNVERAFRSFTFPRHGAVITWAVAAALFLGPVGRAGAGEIDCAVLVGKIMAGARYGISIDVPREAVRLETAGEHCFDPIASFEKRKLPPLTGIGAPSPSPRPGDGGSVAAGAPASQDRSSVLRSSGAGDAYFAVGKLRKLPEKEQAGSGAGEAAATASATDTTGTSVAPGSSPVASAEGSSRADTTAASGSSPAASAEGSSRADTTAASGLSPAASAEGSSRAEIGMEISPGRVTISPGTASPGTASPGTASPGTASPGTASPGTASSGTASSGAGIETASSTFSTVPLGGRRAGTEGPVTSECSKVPGSFWQAGEHDISGVTYRLSGVFTIDIDGDGVVDDVGFKFKKKGRVDNVIRYFAGASRRRAGEDMPGLRIADRYDIFRLCPGVLDFDAKPEAEAGSEAGSGPDAPPSDLRFKDWNKTTTVSERQFTNFMYKYMYLILGLGFAMMAASWIWLVVDRRRRRA